MFLSIFVVWGRGEGDWVGEISGYTPLSLKDILRRGAAELLELENMNNPF